MSMFLECDKSSHTQEIVMGEINFSNSSREK